LSSPAPRFGRRVQLAVLLASFVSTLLVGECVLRIAWHNPFLHEEPDRFTLVRLHHARTDWIVDRTQLGEQPAVIRLQSDTRGYLLPTRPTGSTATPDLVIAFLGGSTTACVAVAPELRFPALTGSLLAEHGIDAEILNAAKPGGTLHDSLNVLLNHLVLDRPDVVVLMHAANDIGMLVTPQGYRPRMGRVVRLSDLAKWAGQMLSSRSAIVGLLRQLATGSEAGGTQRNPWRKNDPSLPPIPTEEFRERLLIFVDTTRDFGSVPVLMTQPLTSITNELTPDWADMGNQDRFNQVTRDVAEERGVLLVDLAREIQETPGWDEPRRYFYDGMHVNDAGSRIYAGIIAAALEPVARPLSAAGHR